MQSGATLYDVSPSWRPAQAPAQFLESGRRIPAPMIHSLLGRDCQQGGTVTPVLTLVSGTGSLGSDADSPSHRRLDGCPSGVTFSCVSSCPSLHICLSSACLLYTLALSLLFQPPASVFSSIIPMMSAQFGAQLLFLCILLAPRPGSCCCLQSYLV